MPTICDVSDIVTVTTVGDYSPEECRATIERVVFDPGYRLGMPVLLDGRRATAPVAADGYRDLVSCLACLMDPFQRLRIAIVTSDARSPIADDAASAMLRVGMLGRVFIDLNEARRWLSVDGNGQVPGLGGDEAP
jgi:hypothetical protein